MTGGALFGRAFRFVLPVLAPGFAISGAAPSSSTRHAAVPQVAAPMSSFATRHDDNAGQAGQAITARILQSRFPTQHDTSVGETARAAIVPMPPPPFPTRDAADTLRITFLDVGQGDAAVIRMPEGQTVVIDAGPGNVVPLLRGLGVTSVDLLVATHPHADHIGGMRRIIESMPVRFYLDNGDAHTTRTYARLLDALEARPEITYLEAVPRTLTLGRATIEILPLPPPGTASLNNRSVALVVRYGEFWALMSGDSEVEQLTGLTSSGAIPDVTLLKAAHHGSNNGFTREFLAVASPEIVVVPVGQNSYGHPGATAMTAYRATGATVFRTDRHGHVTILARQDGWYEALPANQIAPEPAAVGGSRRYTNELTISVQADAPGNDHQNPNGEYAVVRNRSATTVAIGGWRLCDAANHCFRFPAGTEIRAGGMVTVFSGEGLPRAGSFHMGFARAVWNNNGDTATLYDGGGSVVLVHTYRSP